MPKHQIINSDVLVGLKALPSNSVHCCITSPPYYALRNYGVDGQIGLEKTHHEFIKKLVEVFEEVRRVLRPDGTLWMNLGDSYFGSWGNYGGQNRGKGTQRKIDSGSLVSNPSYEGREREKPATALKSDTFKSKDRMGIPHRVVFALQDSGWYWRDEIVWYKPSAMPESVTDRTTKTHEFVFMLSKSEHYYYDQLAIVEPVSGNAHPRGKGLNPKAKKNDDGSKQNTSFSASINGMVEQRNKRSVWKVASAGYKGAHFATFPPKLIIPMIQAGTSVNGCCPMCGKPSKRLIEKVRVPTRPGKDTKVPQMVDVLEVGNRDPQRHTTIKKTVGWSIDCECPVTLADMVPCTVLDPFAGSGTTLAVSLSLGRDAIGIELNPEYIPLIEKRIADTMGLFA